MPLIITVDGPAASGKSSAARTLSKRLTLPYLDSGALYRAMAWKVLKNGMNPAAESQVEAFCRNLCVTAGKDDQGAQVIWVDSEDVTPFLRDPEVTRAASLLSTALGVRRHILSLQREIAKNGIVAEGRDMGTVVFPDATVKFYLDATLPVRGDRRFKELQAKGISCTRESVISDIEKRDQRDRQRDVAPLYPATDAILIDSTFLSLATVISLMEHHTLASGLPRP